MLQEHSLWQFSLKVYEHAPLQSLLLDAQDRVGVDVNFVLAALWLAERGMVLQQERTENLWQSTAELREQGIAPLRALRRAWKHIGVLQDPRRDLQALELRLEKEVQDMLYQALVVEDLADQAIEQAVPFDLEALIGRNLAALVVSDPVAWDALEPRIVAEYRAISGQC